MNDFIRHAGVFALMMACLTIGALLGMAYDPNWEYCRPNPQVTVLAPSSSEDPYIQSAVAAQHEQDNRADCHYEQSTEEPGLEVCK